MSRIAKNTSLLFKRVAINNGLIGNRFSVISSKAMPFRSISSVVSARQSIQMSLSSTSIIAKRFAANSPQSDKEMTEFLASEIELEKKSQKKALPSLPGWSISTDGSNVTLKKKHNNEEITIKTNVNHSVDAENFDEHDDQAREDQGGQMVSRPDFSIEIKRANTILGINCSFISNEDIENEPVSNEELEGLKDEFQINEISIYEGEFKENSYAVSGEVMDGSMYDLLMDLLQERGIDQNFAKALVEYSTVYEHSQYVGLLERLKSFLSQK